MAAIFAAARSQAPVARYLRGEGREDEEAPALHYFAMAYRRYLWLGSS